MQIICERNEVAIDWDDTSVKSTLLMECERAKINMCEGALSERVKVADQEVEIDRKM